MTLISKGGRDPNQRSARSLRSRFDPKSLAQITILRVCDFYHKLRVDGDGRLKRPPASIFFFLRTSISAKIRYVHKV